MNDLQIAINALEEIRNKEGKVCSQYEICEHVSCSSSYASWAIADEVLRRLTKSTADGLCQNCGRDYFENETIVDGELRCACARR